MSNSPLIFALFISNKMDFFQTLLSDTLITTGFTYTYSEYPKNYPKSNSTYEFSLRLKKESIYNVYFTFQIQNYLFLFVLLKSSTQFILVPLVSQNYFKF